MNVKKYVAIRLAEMNTNIYSIAKSINKRDSAFRNYLNGKQNDIYFNLMNNFLLQIFTPTEIAAIYEYSDDSKWDFKEWHQKAIIWLLHNNAKVSYIGSPYVNESGINSLKPYIKIQIDDICSYRIYDATAVDYFPSGDHITCWLYIMDWMHDPQKYLNHKPGNGYHPFNFKEAEKKYSYLVKENGENNERG